MDRKKALAGAGAVALTAAAAALAISAAFGMVGFSDTAAKTGKLSTVTHMESAPQPTPKVETVIEDIPAPDDGASASTSDDSVGAAPVQPAAAPAAAPTRSTQTRDGVAPPTPTATPQHIDDSVQREPKETSEPHELQDD